MNKRMTKFLSAILCAAIMVNTCVMTSADTEETIVTSEVTDLQEETTAYPAAEDQELPQTITESEERQESVPGTEEETTVPAKEILPETIPEAGEETVPEAGEETTAPKEESGTEAAPESAEEDPEASE